MPWVKRINLKGSLGPTGEIGPAGPPGAPPNLFLASGSALTGPSLLGGKTQLVTVPLSPSMPNTTYKVSAHLSGAFIGLVRWDTSHETVKAASSVTVRIKNEGTSALAAGAATVHVIAVSV